jgi:hypothetical protein
MREWRLLVCSKPVKVQVVTKMVVALAALVVVLAVAAAHSAAADDMTLVKLPAYVARGAMCIDGSPAAYYIRRNASSTQWVLYFRGALPPFATLSTTPHARLCL